MSHSTSLADYRTALSTPAARLPVIASIFGRLPIAMISLSLLLFVHNQTGSFGVAGLISAASLVGVAIGSVGQGRLIDRYGPTRPLIAASAAVTCFGTLIVLAVTVHAATTSLVLLALLLGLSQPAVGAASRALWPRIVPPGAPRRAAYSYEAISMEVFFVLGPGLAGLLVTAPWHGTGLVSAIGCLALGTISFALAPTVRGWGPNTDTHPGGKLLGVLRAPGLRVLAVAVLGFGMVIGFVEVGVPAVTSAEGHPGLGGLLLSVWSLSSVGFGVLYSLHPLPRAISLRLPTLLAAFAVLVAAIAATSGLLPLALAMLLAGMMITPQSTTHSLAIDVVVPVQRAGEAFGWVITAVTLGLAFGQSVGGAVAQHFGPHASFLGAGICGTLLAAAVFALRSAITSAETSSSSPRASNRAATALH